MPKSKKHSPQQVETKQSIVDQVPSDLMQDFINGLMELAKQTKSGETPKNMEPRVTISYGSPEDWMEEMERREREAFQNGISETPAVEE